MEERLANHLQHGAAPQSQQTPIRGQGTGVAPTIVPGGSRNPAQISQRYGVVEIVSPRDVPEAESEGTQPDRDDR